MTIRPPSKRSWKNMVSTIPWRSPQMKSACNTAASRLFPLRSCSTRKAASFRNTKAFAIHALLGLPIGNVRVETFDDTGQIFIKNAVRATELPGVDLSKLTPEQKIVALHKFNAEGCTCGCQYTLAQCRIYDRNCQISKGATEKIIAALSGVTRAPATAAVPPAPAQPTASPSPEKPPE